MVVDRAPTTGYVLNFTNNRANLSIVYSMEATTHWSSVIFLSNVGSLCVLESTVTLTDVYL